MFNRLKNRVLSVVTPDLPALPGANSSSLFTNHQQQHLQNPQSYTRGSSSSNRHNANPHNLPDKFAYSRPGFLQLCTTDELRASADHNVRPIIVPRDVGVMPWSTGYAECVNSGKSEWNEDQAAFQRHTLSLPPAANKSKPMAAGSGDAASVHLCTELPYIYFGTFDGHAGYGAALAASHQFHHILHEKLVDVIEMLMPTVVVQDEDDDDDDDCVDGGGGKKKSVTLNSSQRMLPHPQTLFQKTVSRDELIIGALESAFAEMDALLAEDRDKYRNAGGCTALVTLFILGKMFVANAGDSRAVLCGRCRCPSSSGVAVVATPMPPSSSLDEDGCNQITANGLRMQIYPTPFSFDHTPDTERPRLLTTARLNPALLGAAGDYVAMEYGKRPQSRDLGTRILYRQAQMRGWAYKTLTPDDLRTPLVTGEGKRSRLLGTIGVTRGFGDHDLRALYTQLPIKPFLSAHPEVRVLDLATVASVPSDANEDGEYGVLVMGTDGLWDVSEPEAVARTVFETLARFPTERHRYTMAAQELVARARGKINDSGHWRLADTRAAATVDDISVTVIPVRQYYEEWRRWERECVERVRNGGSTAAERKISVAEEAAVEPRAAGCVEVKEALESEELLSNGLLRLGETPDGEETIAVELEEQAAGETVVACDEVEDELDTEGSSNEVALPLNVQLNAVVGENGNGVQTV